MPHPKLPEPFRDLEAWADVWALSTETARNARRRQSSMAEIRAFYDTLLPRMEAVLHYLSQFPLRQTAGYTAEPTAGLPDDARRLLYLSLAMAEVTTAVEIFQAPSVIDGFDPLRFVPDHERAKD